MVFLACSTLLGSPPEAINLIPAITIIKTATVDPKSIPQKMKLTNKGKIQLSVQTASGAFPQEAFTWIDAAANVF